MLEALIALLCLSAPAQVSSDDLRVTLIPDAWPGQVRATGYEYNQKNHRATPEFVRKDRSKGIQLPLSGNRRFRLVG